MIRTIHKSQRCLAIICISDNLRKVDDMISLDMDGFNDRNVKRIMCYRDHIMCVQDYTVEHWEYIFRSTPALNETIRERYRYTMTYVPESAKNFRWVSKMFQGREMNVLVYQDRIDAATMIQRVWRRCVAMIRADAMRMNPRHLFSEEHGERRRARLMMQPHLWKYARRCPRCRGQDES